MSDTERQKLYDNECECMILSQMFINDSVIPNIINAVQESDFFNATNRRIFKAICKIHSSGTRPDALSVHIEIGRREEEWSYVLDLLNMAATTANWNYYCNEVKLYSQVRGCVALSDELRNVTPKNVQAKLSEMLMNGTRLSNVSGGQTIRTIQQLIPLAIANIEEAYKNKGKLVGLDTLIDGINDMLDGWPNDYVLIGARPSAGKTALAGTLIRNIASQGIPCGFVTIEMRDLKIVMRMISGATGINSRSMRNGLLSQANFCQIQDACSEMFNQKIFFDDASSDLERLKQACRTMVRVHGCKALFIDHASMVTVDDNSQHWEKMSLVSKTVKSLQRELDVPTALLCQLKTDAEGREPTMADLRGSGSFAEDADTILLLHRERVATAGQPGIAIPSMLKSVKTRDGDIGDIPLMFFPQTTTFRDPPKKP